MTANELIRKLQEQVAKLSSGDVPIKFNGKVATTDADVELVERPNGYIYINITPIYF